MTPNEALDSASDIIVADIDDAQREFARKIGQIQSDHARRGVLGSTLSVAVLAEACEAELSTRAKTIWDALSESTTALARHPFDGLYSDIARAFETHLMRSTDVLAATIRQAGTPAESNTTLLCVQRFQNCAQVLISKYQAKARVFVDNRGVSPDDAPARGATIHFHGPVYGNVQTGDAATANQTINIGAAREDIAAAIDRLEALLPTLPPGHETAVADVRQVVVEIRAEVARGRPNLLKVAGLLAGIGGAIQTAGALGPAYEMIRQLLSAHFGIELPPRL